MSCFEFWAARPGQSASCVLGTPFAAALASAPPQSPDCSATLPVGASSGRLAGSAANRCSALLAHHDAISECRPARSHGSRRGGTRVWSVSGGVGCDSAIYREGRPDSRDLGLPGRLCRTRTKQPSRESRPLVSSEVVAATPGFSRRFWFWFGG